MCEHSLFSADSHMTVTWQSHDLRFHVQVNFSVQDGVPQDQYKAVLRRSGGSMEMLTSLDDTTEPSYKLVLHQECVKSVKIVSKTS